MMAAAAILFAMVKSYAAGSYETTDNVTTFSDAAGKRTVFIKEMLMILIHLKILYMWIRRQTLLKQVHNFC